MKRQKDINCAGGAIRPIMKRHRGQYDAGYELLDMRSRACRRTYEKGGTPSDGCI